MPKGSNLLPGLEPTGTAKRVWLWWSTGKDSAWTLHRLRSDPDVRVERLITTVTPRFGRVAIHGTRLEILQAQTEAVGLPLETIELPYPCSNADYLEVVAPVLRRAEAQSVDQMAFGDLFLEDVRQYREELLAEFDLEPVFPLWQSDTTELATEIVDSGVEAYVTSLDPGRVDRSLAGARFDGKLLDRLPGAVDPCGENGEFHTCVAGGPMMSCSLQLARGEVVAREGFVYADLLLENRDQVNEPESDEAMKAGQDQATHVADT